MNTRPINSSSLAGTTERDEPRLSVVVPFYNEADNLKPLAERILEVLENTGQSGEVLFIDDGSTDGSDRVARSICDLDSRCRLIRFRRNFGQTAALSAGLSSSRGSVIITIDADLQNDPADIPILLAKLEDGFDLVNGWRQERHDPFLSRRLPSSLANWLISLITGLRIHDFGCSLKAIRREIADEMKLYGEMHRFIPAIADQVGARIAEIPVRHHARVSGTSKYGISRTFRVILDLMTVKFLSEYSTRPSHLFGLLGLVALIGGCSVTGFLVMEKVLFKAELADRPLLLLAVFVTILGVQLITMGLIGEMLSRVYHESQKKPIYVVKEEYPPEPRELPQREVLKPRLS